MILTHKDYVKRFFKKHFNIITIPYMVLAIALTVLVFELTHDDTPSVSIECPDETSYKKSTK